MELDSLIISSDKNLINAYEKLNNVLREFSVSRLILFVVEEKKVVGTITDGDIRRSILTNKNLYSKVGDICNRNFAFIYETSDFINFRQFRDRDLKIIPVLNKDKYLVRIIDLEKTKSQLPLECVIMAGGRGKRLSPLTDTTPKPMLPLGGKPIIEHNIDRLISYGIKKFYITVKYLGEQIEEHFGDGAKKGVEIHYVRETEPLGTAGALSLIPEIKSDHLLLMNSDLLTNVDFEDLYITSIKENADITVASTEYKVDIPYAIFETKKNRVTAFKEKPSYSYYSNAGIYILKKEVIDRIPKNSFCDITDVMEEIVNENKILIHRPIVGYWIDIGKPSDYKQAEEFVKHLDS